MIYIYIYTYIHTHAVMSLPAEVPPGASLARLSWPAPSRPQRHAPEFGSHFRDDVWEVKSTICGFCLLRQ